MSELDKTIEELESEVIADLNEAEMKKDSSPSGKGAVASEPMKKVDAEEDDIEDLGAPVVKGDEKKADAAKSVMKDGSILEQGEAKNILNNPQNDYTKNLIKSAFDIVY